MNLMPMETAETIHEFWFGSSADDLATIKAYSHLWWSKKDAVDHEIRQRFEPMIHKAANRELESWADAPQSLMALILLTDQFPRNAYRNTPRAFAFDSLARAWSRAGLELGFHLRLRPIERVFMYLPLEHSESLEDQERSVALYRELAGSVNPALRADFDGFLSFAIRHWDIIQRFGRFPHRNQILGRDSTQEEIAFLREKGSSF
jgi:uncharacterized protein (DUF924 family)